MDESAAAARTDRPANVSTWGKPFEKGNPGRPPGIVDKRIARGVQTARALEGQAWLVLRELLHHPSWKARETAAKTILAYACGLPRQTLELTGGLGDLAAELAAALAEVRARRSLPAAESGPGGRPMDEEPRLLAENGEKGDSGTILSAAEVLPAEAVEASENGDERRRTVETAGGAISKDVESGGHEGPDPADGRVAPAAGIPASSEGVISGADDPKAVLLPASDVPANGDEPRDDEDEANVEGES
jgi:hypothetical protein